MKTLTALLFALAFAGSVLAGLTAAGPLAVVLALAAGVVSVCCFNTVTR